jgi:hypothetical protein
MFAALSKTLAASVILLASDAPFPKLDTEYICQSTTVLDRDHALAMRDRRSCRLGVRAR